MIFVFTSTFHADTSVRIIYISSYDYDHNRREIVFGVPLCNCEIMNRRAVAQMCFSWPDTLEEMDTSVVLHGKLFSRLLKCFSVRVYLTKYKSLVSIFQAVGRLKYV